MNHELEITGYCYEMKDASMTKAVLNGKKYDLSLYIEHEQKEDDGSQSPLIEDNNIDNDNIKNEEYWRDRERRLGKIVSYHKHVGIREVPLQEIKEHPEISAQVIIKKYFPHIKDTSVESYASRYRDFLQSELQRFEPEPEREGKEIVWDIDTTQKPPSLDSREFYKKLKDRRLGKVVAVSDHLYLREFPLMEMRKNPNTNGRDIIKKYFPQLMKNSVRTYAYRYKRYLKQEQFYIDSTPILKTHLKKSRKRRRKPYGKVCYNKSYRMWIDKKELINVQKAIQKWNFIPTAKAITKETQLRKNIVHCILDHLLQKHLIYKEVVDRTPIYRSVSFTPRV